MNETPFPELKCLNALELKILALVLMLCDHTWASLMHGHVWMTCIGRLAFPIFAFQVAEGFRKTSHFGKYLGRMFLFALISEIPFNLMIAGSWFYPLHQNVMFTFTLALLAMKILDLAKRKGPAVFLPVLLAVLAVGFVLGSLSMVDYGGGGIWMVLLFYLTYGLPFGWLVQLAGMFYVNWDLLGGLVFKVTILGHTLGIPEQGLAVLALIPIWLYNGRQGPKNKAIQYACYSFYPLHMLVLALAALSRI